MCTNCMLKYKYNYIQKSKKFFKFEFNKVSLKDKKIIGRVKIKKMNKF